MKTNAFTFTALLLVVISCGPKWSSAEADGFGLNWSGIISDARTAKHSISAEP